MDNKKRILIVDDNQELCENLSDILEMEDYETVSVHDGFHALEIVKSKKFDLVLMDIKMPVINGVETFKKLKKIAPETPVIMLSAFTVEDLIKDAISEGAFGFLKKPIDFDKLFELIEKSTQNSSLILVVDDNPEICDNLKDILVSNSYQVDIAFDGYSAVQKARESAFDIIILDLKLPALNGLDTFLAIREYRPNVVVIVITGHREDMYDIAKKISTMDVYAVIDKPLEMDKFLKLLNCVL